MDGVLARKIQISGRAAPAELMGSEMLNGLSLPHFVLQRFVSFRWVFVNGSHSGPFFDSLKKGRLDTHMRR